VRRATFVRALPSGLLAVAFAAGCLAGSAQAQGASPVRLAGSDRSPVAARRGVSGPEIVLGIAGSAAGMWGGAYAGLAMSREGSGCVSGCSVGGSGGCAYSCGDAAFGAGVIGLVAGSVLGTAIGTHLGAKLAHRPPGGFGRRLLAGGVGFLAGIGAVALAGRHADGTLVLIGFPVVQGVVGALMGGQR
jgi:hypothetical protein